MARPGPIWLEPVPVRDWMRAPVVTVRSDTTVAAAGALMRKRGIRHLPVTDADGRLVGILTDRDLRQAVFDPALDDRLADVAATLAELPVSRVMTWGVVSVSPTTDLRHAARVMHERKIGALPVVERGRVVGILTESDVLLALEAALRGRTAVVGRARDTAALASRYDYGFPPPGGEDPWTETGEPA